MIALHVSIISISIYNNPSGVRDYCPYLSMITSECKCIFTSNTESCFTYAQP